MTTVEEQVVQLAQKARAWRLAGEHHHGRESEFPLVGYCFDNAYVAASLFQDAGFTTHLIEGTTERVADDLIAEGISPRDCESVSELGGLVHYWLEVDVPSRDTFYVDIASDSFETLGECLVTRELPSDYIELPDSRQEGMKTFEMVQDRGDRCSCCGDQQYTEGGCPACYDQSSPDME